MHYSHPKLVLRNVSQNKLVEYLRLLGSRSYVSPTVNHYTVMYDLSFEIHIGNFDDALKDAKYIFDYALKWVDPLKREEYRAYQESSYISAVLEQQNMFDLTLLNPTSPSILNQYKGLPEGNLRCWASHLSKHFSCAALAFYLRDDSGFWYHLSQNGTMLDEYTTYAEVGWQPGQPIFSETGTVIAGGNSRILCSALDQPNKVNEVEIILRKPHTLDNNYPSDKPDYETLLNSNGFSEEKMRHWALAKVLGMHPWWTIWMGYEAIVSGEAQEDFDDHEPPSSSWAEIVAQIKSSQPISELKYAAEGSTQPGKLAIIYADKRVKRKGIRVFSPENILDDFRTAIQELTMSVSSENSNIPTLLSEFVEVNLNNLPLTESGKFNVIEHLMTVIEALTDLENLEMRQIGLSAMFELKKMSNRWLLSPSGQLWLDCEPILRLALERDCSSS